MGLLGPILIFEGAGCVDERMADKMLGQAAACLALDVDKAATPGGFWTPATIFGDRLIQRLTAHSGLAFEVVPDLQN